jgi:hypothetical protein
LEQYRAWFQGECNSIVVEPGLTVSVKLFSVNSPAPPWTLHLAIIFPDGMYICIYEHYRSLAKADGGGGRLQYISYHYGPASAQKDADGFPVKSDECILRIDDAPRWGKHAHYEGEDHIPERRLPGLNFDAITAFDFIKAVKAYRETNRPLHEILGFEVSPKV